MPIKTIPKKSGGIKRESKKQPAKMKKKIVLLGDTAVGKTSLIRRFVFDQFEDSYVQTIGSKVTKKDLVLEKGGRDIKMSLMIWDLLGLQGFTALHANTFVGVHGALLVSDLGRVDTLKSFERYWLPLLFDVVHNIPLVFVGNKADLKAQMKLRPKDMEDIASKYNVGIIQDLPSHLSSHYMTSAKTGENVEKAFHSLGHLLLSPELLEDPMREISERGIAELISKSADKRSSTGAIDALIMDFSKGFKNEKKAMTVLRLEFIRAGLDLGHPTRDSLLRAVDFLAEAEAESRNETTIRENKERRLKLIDGIKKFETYKLRKIKAKK